MRLGLFVVLVLLGVTWFEFQIYPGHSYLQGETQLLVPMLERLDTPGFLSRDLVASNPTFAYTIYDEITQVLHSSGHLSFEDALLRQQIFFRFVAILGVFLCARALKVAPLESVILSGAVNAITQLTAPAAFVTNPEATPVSFSLSLTLLAAGLLVNRSALMASLAGGVALLYDPVTALPFWVLVIAIWASERSLRKLLRPAWPVLVISLLILGNIMQLQAGLGSGQDLTGRMSAAMVALTQIRTPWTWASIWAKYEIWSYLFLAVAGAWALACFGKLTDRLTKWVVIGLSLGGLVSVAVAAVLLALRVQFSMEMPPARNLSFTIAMSILLCGAQCWHAAQMKRWKYCLPWAALLVAAILNAQVLDLLRGKLAVAAKYEPQPELISLTTWAEQSTWGSSMFQFADLARQNQPGIFRALSRRAIWADWESGVMADYSDQLGQEWWSRWEATMSNPYSSTALQNMLIFPVDYYVLQRSHALAGIKPTYANSAYVVYDAQDLREAPGLLH